METIGCSQSNFPFPQRNGFDLTQALSKAHGPPATGTISGANALVPRDVRGREAVHHPWLMLLGIYIALQLPLGMLVGDFCAAGGDDERLELIHSARC
jgi:hypothetical protein